MPNTTSASPGWSRVLIVGSTYRSPRSTARLAPLRGTAGRPRRVTPVRACAARSTAAPPRGSDPGARVPGSRSRRAAARTAARTGTPRTRARRALPADVGVAVAVGAQRRLGVVEMQRPEPIDADDAIELVERRSQTGGGADVITGREQVAGVQAHAEALRRSRQRPAARPAPRNERPSVPPAPAVSSRCSGQRSVCASASAITGPARPIASLTSPCLADPGCRTTPAAPMPLPTRSDWTSEAATSRGSPGPRRHS